MPSDTEGGLSAAEAQARRAYRVPDLLRSRLRVSARVRRDGGWRLIAARELVPGEDVAAALDSASSGFHAEGLHHLRTENREVEAAELVAMYAAWADTYPVCVLEDGLAEDDWAGWKLLKRELGGTLELMGDDLLVTNVERIQRGIDEDAANAVLIKPNQIGTLTETSAAVNLAYAAHWGAMVSHRSGGTVDSFVADLTVALATGQLKTSAPGCSERVENYTQLLRIEEYLGASAVYAGHKAFVT